MPGSRNLDPDLNKSCPVWLENRAATVRDRSVYGTPNLSWEFRSLLLYQGSQYVLVN